MRGSYRKGAVFLGPKRPNIGNFLWFNLIMSKKKKDCLVVFTPEGTGVCRPKERFVVLILCPDTEKMPVLKAEASHYNADLNNLLLCCQCVDVVFHSPDLEEVAEAHKIVLCAVSHVFMLLFSVKSPADIQDSSIIQTTQDLFTINRDPAFPGASQESPGNPPLRVIVKDAFFCSCLADILRFIYSGILSDGSGAAPQASEMKCARGLRVCQLVLSFPSSCDLR